MDYTSILEEMITTARSAGDFLRSERAGLQKSEIEEKSQGDLVSRIDRDCEELIKEKLLGVLPDSVFMAEESSPDASGGEFRWIIDPLDGTLNYLQGLPVYAVSIALHTEENDIGSSEVKAGVIYLPHTDDLYEAAIGTGSRKNGNTIRVSQNTRESRAVLATGFPFRNREVLTPLMESFKDLFMRTANIRRIGSAAADLAWVAEGVFDGFWETNLSPWDIAAGEIIIREAGGIITDFWGRDVLHSCWPVAASPHMYPLLIETVRKHFPDAVER